MFARFRGPAQMLKLRISTIPQARLSYHHGESITEIDHRSQFWMSSSRALRLSQQCFNPKMNLQEKVVVEKKKIESGTYEKKRCDGKAEN